jgi:hypothetical protein
MIEIGVLRVAQKIAKETTKGLKYSIKAEDMDGNKLTLELEHEDFKAYSIGDPIDPHAIEWQDILEGGGKN